ncbi:glycosyl hydrolase [Chengkuizengella axinellae]|uniref:glucan endo-1,3-beta-D-glucosidase n=1 Tax=Chengkuizengella axinellae TaxID=3064388 RepID=A0ABT9J015_9BACL|nr:glycosyl hydrolase [Chengkuizengella sp. 2205SS18-9]MDP5274957.1 glycosyl hydrolase [Chengkuizengella sp. 2205SS18-9]
MNKIKFLSIMTTLTLIFTALIPANFAIADITEDDVAVGEGGYSTVQKGNQLYNWVLGPRKSPPAEDYTTSNFDGKPLPTNDWLTSVLWHQYSGALYAHPLSFQATPTGFEISNPPKTVKTLLDGENELEREHRPGQIDLEVQATTFSPADAKADKLDDWSADILMASGDGSKNMKATIAHGSPFAYFTFEGAEPKVKFNLPTTILHQDGSSIQISVNNNGQTNYYGLYAPTGTTWTNNGNEVIADLPTGKDFFTVAGLPEGSINAFNLYKDRAFAFITDTRVDWNYDEASSTLTTDYIIETTPMEGTNTETVTALYPHQWRYNPLISESTYLYSYNTIRGTMKAITGNGFSTQYVFNGILPWMPALTDSEDITKLEDYVTEYFDYGMGLNPPFINAGADQGNGGYDTYWMGKNLGRVSNLAPITAQLNDDEKTDAFVESMKNTMEWWFTPTKYNEAGQPVDDNYFYYDDHWKTLIGYSASYFSDTELNDHHFHWGYWIYAAAQVALQEPNTVDAWDQEDQWGGMVNELVGDIATTDRDSTKYPFLRNFDPYAGHSWANGPGFIDADDWRYGGNNHESSSEAMNAWASLILWGEATGNDEIRDAGIYMYTTEREAINNYWFDIYGDVLEPEYSNDDVVMVWGGKYNHTTWWTENPVEAHGIQILPITPASLYLGTDPDYVALNYNNTYDEFPNYLQKKEQYGWAGLDNTDAWQDILVSYYALSNPAEALTLWKDEDTEIDPAVGVEFGESRAHTYQWIRSLDVYGLPNFDVTANTPLYSVFNKNGVNTYVAYNASDLDITVTFSDCYELIVPANAMAQETAVSPGGNCSNTPPSGGEPPVPDTEEPTAPTNLTAANVSETTVELTWTAGTDNVGITAYDVYQNGSLLNSTTRTSYEVTGLIAESTHTFTVVAKDRAGNESAASNGLTVTTEATPAGGESITIIETDFVVEIIDEGTEVTLSFTPTESSNLVDLRYVINDGVQQNVPTINNNGTWEFTIPAVSEGNHIEFYYTYVKNGLFEDTAWYGYEVGTGLVSNPDPTDTIAPIAPADLIFTAKDETTVDLAWTAATDNVGVVGYDVYQNGVYVNSTTATSYQIIGLTENTAYTFEVKAKDLAGNESAASNVLAVTTDAAPVPGDGNVIVEPEFTIEIVDNGDSVTLKFVPENPLVLADVHYKVNNGGQLNVRSENNNGIWEYTIPGVSTGDVIDFQYTYIVNLAHDTEWYQYIVGSGETGGTPEVPTEPEPPVSGGDNVITGPDFTIEIEHDGNNVTLKFVPENPLVLADVHYKVNDGGQLNVKSVNQNGIWEYTIPDVSAGDVIDFQYTYIINLAHDTDWYQYIVGSGLAD